MDPIVVINEYVRVIFDCPPPGSRFICWPICMFRNRQRIDFVAGEGLRHPTVAGKRMLHVFTVTDGSNDYRLEFDAEALIWKLVSVMPGDSL